SVFWHRWVDFVGPGENSAFEVVNFAEAGFLEEIDGLGRALAAAAMGHDFAGRIEFMHAARQLAEWDQLPLQIADLIFMWFADIENEEIVATIKAHFQFARGDFWYLQIRGGCFFAANAAEFVVVDELVDGAIRSAHRAVRVLAELEFAEFHAQRVEEEQ